LLVANPSSVEYDGFKYAEMQEELKQHSSAILDTSEGQVFLNINICMSDFTGTRF
jgi:hypothetical protein